MTQKKIILGPGLPNIPWEERPAGSNAIMWRYSARSLAHNLKVAAHLASPCALPDRLMRRFSNAGHSSIRSLSAKIDSSLRRVRRTVKIKAHKW